MLGYTFFNCDGTAMVWLINKQGMQESLRVLFYWPLDVTYIYEYYYNRYSKVDFVLYYNINILICPHGPALEFMQGIYISYCTWYHTV